MKEVEGEDSQPQKLGQPLNSRPKYFGFWNWKLGFKKFSKKIKKGLLEVLYEK